MLARPLLIVGNLLGDLRLRARELLPRVRYDTRDLYLIAQLTSEMDVDGHREDAIIKEALAEIEASGEPTDPAAWHDWLASVYRIKSGQPPRGRT